MSPSTTGRIGYSMFLMKALCATVAVVGATALVISAQSPAHAQRGDTSAASTTVLGSYMAGRLARSHHDTTSAAVFYRQALQRDPANTLVLENSFLAEAAEGETARATELARQVIAQPQGNRLAHIWLAAVAMKDNNLTQVQEHLTKGSGGGPIGDLTITLARAWVHLAEGNSSRALEGLRTSRIPEAAQSYNRFHRALISDLAGRRSDAAREYEVVFKQDPRTPRVALAYAQHAASAGDLKLARAVLKDHADKVSGDGQPMVTALQNQLQGNDVIRLLIESPQQGYAEVFYGLGEALASEGGVSLGGIYLQIALLLRPDAPFTLAALANVHELTKRYDAAIAVYNRIPLGTPLQRAVEIRKAVNLNLLERVDEAKLLLLRLSAEVPDDVRPLVTLGDIMRAHKRFDEAIEYFNRVIAMTAKPEAKHWTYWYARGTSYERLKRWPQAEVDLLRALQLSPDQPLILNYLGYSWIDQNRNLKQGLAMIEKAVAAKPDDGYIVDSLGWANFRLGNFKEAVRYLERAVELRPEDPVLNDHLGDAYWRVGREREAKFQWEQALSLKPEPDDAEKIQVKLQRGLASLVSPKSAAKKSKQAGRPDSPRKQVERQTSPVSPFQ